MDLNIFSPLNGGQLSTFYAPEPRLVNLNVGQNYSRNQQGTQLFPYPQMCGILQDTLPIMNQVEITIMSNGKRAYGPWFGEPQQNPSDVFKNMFGGMTKNDG